MLPLFTKPSSSNYHVIIIGAGWYGIAAAKTYLQIDASVSLLLIDENSSVGGVWSKSRIYPDLIADQPTPLFEYPDLSMREAIGLEDWSDITGDHFAEYFEIYATKFGITKRCKFNTKVKKIDRDTNGKWQVFGQPANQSNGAMQLFTSDKLIMATGFASIPELPENLDENTYTGQICHVKEIGQRYHELLGDKTVQTVTVVGGHKSAWEMAGMFALEGKRVHWIIRENGSGPAPMCPARPDGKNHIMKGKNIRAMSALVPNPYYPNRWLTRFLYGGKNWFSRWFRVNFWMIPLKAALQKLKSPKRSILMPKSHEYVLLLAKRL
jgi:dimethylaniline monooxygenase (N-oxide forming)